jgi:ribosomal protein S18 acetylase RimI-like enzyme
MALMPSDAPNTPLTMVRDDMENIPELPLPAGYRLRSYVEGDERTWLELHIAGEPFVEMTPELFKAQFGDGLDVLPERMYFVETLDGVAAGSITAWWETDRYKMDERGRIHWVIVHPVHRRVGIAKAMMTQAMHTLRAHYRWAMLETSARRPIALKMYLDYGFLPDPAARQDEETLAGWQRVQEQIHHPALRRFLDKAKAQQ